MSLWTRMANVFQEAQVNREIDDELEAHVVRGDGIRARRGGSAKGAGLAAETSRRKP
jgi:hypothetical protein